jgi:hypothetical protein
MATFRLPAAYEPQTCFLDAKKLRVWVYSHRRSAQAVAESFLKQGFVGFTDLFDVTMAGSGLFIVEF